MSNNPGKFHWPEGKNAAVSLSFDDAHPSQIDNGMPIFDRYGINATFYVLASLPYDRVKERLADWRKVAANGYEIGNHTLTHPCTGNFQWSRENALEDYTLEMMQKELDEANAVIEKLLGVKPVVFAYPAGQKFIGRGKSLKSYVPLVAERFIVGRGWHDEGANDPAFCDLAQVMGVKLDGLDFEEVKPLLEQAKAEGRWLILCGHEINQPNFQTTHIQTLEAICKYAKDPANKLWIDTVQTIGCYILQHRDDRRTITKR